MATLVFTEGWEHGRTHSYPGSPGAGMSNSTSQHHSGSRSARFYTASAAACSLYYAQTGAFRYKVGRVYVRFAAWPSADIRIIATGIQSLLSHSIYLDVSEHKLQARVGTNELNTCDLALSLDTWYRIDYRFNSNANPNLIDFQVAEGDGAATAATQSSYAQAQAYITSNSIGWIETDTADLYFDDWIMSETSADYPLGPGGVVGLSPNAAGTSSPGSSIYDNGDTLVNDSTNPANVELDDVPMTSTADYIKQTAIGASDYAEVAFADTTESDIKGADAVVLYDSLAADANSAGTKIRDSNGQETTLYEGDMSETTALLKRATIATPSGGWTMAHVNALVGRVGYATNVTSIPCWHSLMIQAAYGITVAANALVQVVNE